MYLTAWQIQNKNNSQNHFGRFLKVRQKVHISFVMSLRLSLCPHVSSPLLLGRFEYNLTLQTVIAIRGENQNLVKITKKKSSPLDETLCIFTFLRAIQNIHKITVVP